MLMKIKDLQLLSHLRKNARTPLAEIARKTNTPLTTLYDRLKRYEKEIIKKHTSLIDFTKLGYNIKLILAIKIDSKQKEQLKEYLLKHKNVNSLSIVNHGFDVLIDCIFEDQRKANNFMLALQEKFNVKKIKMFNVIEDLKQEAFLTNEKI